MRKVLISSFPTSAAAEKLGRKWIVSDLGKFAIHTTRIGATGYSLGGLMTFLLTAVEPRIKVAVPCVTPQKFFDMPGIEVLAPWHYAGAVGDRPFLMLMGRSDPNNYLVEDAQRLYEFIKGSQKELLFYESGHSLPMEHVPDSIEWFKKHL